MKLGITSSLDGGVMYDARLHADLTRRSHSKGSALPPASLDIVAAFAFFYVSNQSVDIVTLLHST